ncbi:MAG: PhzF family phenazine biosynthesis protein [Streptosporangiaceae bacterium]
MGTALEFRHLDVFTNVPFTGNGLIVLFGNPAGIGAEALITVTVEMRQFELILAGFQPGAGRVPARIFTAEEELPFAGHPVIGAAAALHERHSAQEPARSWVFVIAGREIIVRSRRTEGYYEAEMNQGVPAVAPPLAEGVAAGFAGALGLSQDDLHRLPVQVISTGLPYLIVPVARGLDRARIVAADFGDRLASVGAKFAYVFDPDKREGRSWDNAGAVEDVATGSAAGPAAAFLAAHGLAAKDETIVISQGRFLGRPSVIKVTPDSGGNLWVGGPVSPVARGVVDLPPG